MGVQASVAYRIPTYAAAAESELVDTTVKAQYRCWWIRSAKLSAAARKLVKVASSSQGRRSGVAPWKSGAEGSKSSCKLCWLLGSRMTAVVSL